MLALHLRGELDLAAVPALERRLEQTWGSAEAVVLDLSELTFIDSSGIKALIGAAVYASEHGRSLEMRDPSETVRRILTVTGVLGTLGLAAGA